MFITGPKVSPNYNGMTITYVEAIERAKSIGEVAKRNVLEAERLRRLPEENVRAIMDSGLMPLLRPRIFGGYEGDWITHIDCVAEVARHCGSTGWCMSFLLQHQFYLGYFPIETQRMVYEQHPDPKIVTSFAPIGKVRAVKGGFEASGRWTFGSCADHCDWAIVGGKVQGDNGPVIYNLLLSPGQFRVERVWNSVGLRGTGSNDLIIDEPAFIPDALVYKQSDALAGNAPGSLSLEGRMYRGPLAYNIGFGVMTAMHGIARGAYESFVEFTRHRVALMGNRDASDVAEIQSAIGESKAEIDLAHLLTQKMSATAVAEEGITVDDIVRTRRDFILLQKLLRQAVDRLFALSGARGLDESLPMQRHWRDFHAISHHFAFSPPSFQTAGRRDLGLGPTPGDIITSFDLPVKGAGAGMD
jgi:3-hydroxy-9,10-secoandrosta-1,3,5(10)-triene-9,17-dione monooxygenase